MALYPDYRLHGARKDWEPTPMDVGSTQRLIGYHPFVSRRKVTDAMAWFGDDGTLRALVADLDNDRRVEFRFGARSTKATLVRKSPTQGEA